MPRNKNINTQISKDACFSSVTIDPGAFIYAKEDKILKELIDLECIKCEEISGERILTTDGILQKIILNTKDNQGDLILNGYEFPEGGQGIDGQALILKSGNVLEWGYAATELTNCLDCNDNGDGTYDLITKPDVKNITLESTNDISIKTDNGNLFLNTYIFPSSGSGQGKALILGPDNKTIEWGFPKTELENCLTCQETTSGSGKYNLTTTSNVQDITLTSGSNNLQLNGYIFPQQSSGSIGQVLTLTALNTIEFAEAKTDLDNCLQCNDIGGGKYELTNTPDVDTIGFNVPGNIVLNTFSDINIQSGGSLLLNNNKFPQTAGNIGDVLSQKTVDGTGGGEMYWRPDIYNCLECVETSPGSGLYDLKTAGNVNDVNLTSTGNIKLDGSKVQVSSSGEFSLLAGYGSGTNAAVYGVFSEDSGNIAPIQFGTSFNAIVPYKSDGTSINDFGEYAFLVGKPNLPTPGDNFISYRCGSQQANSYDLNTIATGGPTGNSADWELINIDFYYEDGETSYLLTCGGEYVDPASTGDTYTSFKVTINPATGQPTPTYLSGLTTALETWYGTADVYDITCVSTGGGGVRWYFAGSMPSGGGSGTSSVCYTDNIEDLGSNPLTHVIKNSSPITNTVFGICSLIKNDINIAQDYPIAMIGNTFVNISNSTGDDFIEINNPGSGRKCKFLQISATEAKLYVAVQNTTNFVYNIDLTSPQASISGDPINSLPTGDWQNLTYTPSYQKPEGEGILAFVGPQTNNTSGVWAALLKAGGNPNDTIWGFKELGWDAGNGNTCRGIAICPQGNVFDYYLPTILPSTTDFQVMTLPPGTNQAQWSVYNFENLPISIDDNTDIANIGTGSIDEKVGTITVTGIPSGDPTANVTISSLTNIITSGSKIILTPETPTEKYILYGENSGTTFDITLHSVGGNFNGNDIKFSYVILTK